MSEVARSSDYMVKCSACGRVTDTRQCWACTGGGTGLKMPTRVVAGSSKANNYLEFLKAAASDPDDFDAQNIRRAITDIERMRVALEWVKRHADGLSAMWHVADRALQTIGTHEKGVYCSSETNVELERLRKLEEHVERVACWVNPQDVYLEIRRTRDDIYNAREERRRLAQKAVAPPEAYIVKAFAQSPRRVAGGDPV